jgi:hypothetical protein
MLGPSAPSAGHLLDVSVLIEHFAAATAAHCAGRQEAGFMAEALADDNPAQARCSQNDSPSAPAWAPRAVACQADWPLLTARGD